MQSELIFPKEKKSINIEIRKLKNFVFINLN